MDISSVAFTIFPTTLQEEVGEDWKEDLLSHSSRDAYSQHSKDGKMATAESQTNAGEVQGIQGDVDYSWSAEKQLFITQHPEEALVGKAKTEAEQKDGFFQSRGVEQRLVDYRRAVLEEQAQQVVGHKACECSSHNSPRKEATSLAEHTKSVGALVAQVPVFPAGVRTTLWCAERTENKSDKEWFIELERAARWAAEPKGLMAGALELQVNQKRD
ncbi:hypothetical protein Esti_005255 [Eimeria stiedai]